MINTDFNSIIELLKAFPTEQSCIDHLEDLRWGGNVISPFNPDSKVYKCKENKYRCKETKKYFNVKTGTLLDNTKVELTKWFLSIWLVTSHKKGISSLQLARDINVTQKTSWFMLQRIRNCFDIDNGKLDNEVEIDETYIGGKNKNRHDNKKVKGTTEDKVPVIGMVERGGKVVARHIPNTKYSTLSKEIIGNVETSAQLYTDEYVSYESMGRIYDHKTIKHSEAQYVRGRIHTNTIEGFWSLLKRMYFGIYHSISRKHLQFYVDEMVFRYNSRKINDCERFNLFLLGSEKRLKYNQIIL